MRSYTLLFTETGGFILEIDPSQEEAITNAAKELDTPISHIGHTTDIPVLLISRGDDILLKKDISDIISHWENGLKKAWT